jgi:nucleoid-associated protein YgaU
MAAVTAGAVVLTGYLGATGVLVWASSGVADAVAAPGPAPLDAQIGLAAATAAWIALTWLGLMTLLALAAELLRGTRPRLHRLAERVTPALLRRAAAGVLGAGLAGGALAGGASATGLPVAAQSPAASSRPAATGSVLPALDRPADLLPGWTPDRPAAPPVAARPPRVHLVATTPHPQRASSDEVVVRRGDTLWDIAARHLGPAASAAEVAVEWPRWHRANRDVIGPEPGLILPGQRLRPPP